MARQPVIAIFDVGKTNKKLCLFNEQYKLLHEETSKFTETKDEEGFPCDNLQNITGWILDSVSNIFGNKDLDVKAINFATYGASLVYIDDEGNSLTPLYNYLKPFPEELKDKFNKAYGGNKQLALETCSPELGNLNSAMQLFRIKYEQPGVYKKIKYAFHLPQYLSFILSGQAYTELTSIGCHTRLWDFKKKDYHEWVISEEIQNKFPPLVPSGSVVKSSFKKNNFLTGAGLHDSSAALIPYLVNFTKPFLLISTGTWCISLNPFNDSALTSEELKQDCLCYLRYDGKPVKASRLFAGYEHEQQAAKIAQDFNRNLNAYQTVHYNEETVKKLVKKFPLDLSTGVLKHKLVFENRKWSTFLNYEEAYHQLMLDIIQQQFISTKLVLKGTAVKRIFVDGGFSSNSIYMNLLAYVFSDYEIFAVAVPEATALGAAIAIHQHWNTLPLPNNVIELNYYSGNT